MQVLVQIKGQEYLPYMSPGFTERSFSTTLSTVFKNDTEPM